MTTHERIISKLKRGFMEDRKGLSSSVKKYNAGIMFSILMVAADEIENDPVRSRSTKEISLYHLQEDFDEVLRKALYLSGDEYKHLINNFMKSPAPAPATPPPGTTKE